MDNRVPEKGGGGGRRRKEGKEKGKARVGGVGEQRKMKLGLVC